MPNPPITVGELTDVPAPESPINAQFHQEVANRIVHRFASATAMNGWAAANGSLAFVSPYLYLRSGGVWEEIGLRSVIEFVYANLQSKIDTTNANLAAAPGGMIARTNGAQHLGMTTATEICRVTFTADPGRWYRTSILIPALRGAGVTVGLSHVVEIRDAAAGVGVYAGVSLDPGEYIPVALSVAETGLTGSTVRRLMVLPGSGGGSLDIPVGGSFTAPWISIEDLGGNLMPSTIGPFTNVPAPGDGVTSVWAQQLTGYAVNNVPLSWYMENLTPIQVFSGGTSVPLGTFTPPTTGLYLIQGWVCCRFGVAGEMNLKMNANATLGPQTRVLQVSAGERVTVPVNMRATLTGGALATLLITAVGPQGTANWVDERFATILRVGAGT